MIPKIIHYCWFGGAPFNDTIQRCIESWKQMLPEYTLVRWDESTLPWDLLPWARQTYRHRRWALLSDYARLYALVTQGGIYLDTDVEVLKPLDPLLVHRAFVGFEQKIINKRPVGNAVIGSEPGFWFVQDCFRQLERSFCLHLKPRYGVKVGNLLLKKLGLHAYGRQTIRELLVCEKEFFYPDEAEIGPETYCIHHELNSWHRKRDWRSKWNRLYYKIARVPGVLRHHLIGRS